MKPSASPLAMSPLIFHLLCFLFWASVNARSIPLTPNGPVDSNLDPIRKRQVMSDSSDGLTERQMPDGREKRWRATTPAKRSAAFNRDNMWDRKETLLKEIGEIGVSAMQISVVDDSHLIIIDKKEDNPLKDINGNPAWGSIYNFKTKKERPLNMITNSFCAGGSWLGNGTLINVGGDIGDTGGDGYQSVRLFTPCPDGKECDIVDDPEGVRMAARRWYASTARIGDGSVLIMGGSNAGAYINSKDIDEPSIEYFPPKDWHGSKNGPIHSKFLEDTLNANLFPIIFFIGKGKVFVAANTKAMIYDYNTNTEQRLPDIPNKVRVTYPMTASGILLPLSKDGDYTPEVLICGGSKAEDSTNGDTISSQTAASDQCIRMRLNEEGIKAGWQVEHMPEARVMPDLVLLPTGDVLIVNGAKTGVAGYLNVKDRVGESNADNPAYTPVVYRPNAKKGERFLTNAKMPTSKIPRLYHSVATLLPSGEVLLAGSNPNGNVNLTEANKYRTEYRVETLSPPYMQASADDRPEIRPPKEMLHIPYNGTFKLGLVTKGAAYHRETLTVSLMDLGFVTHSVHMNSRLVQLEVDTGGSGDGETDIIHIAGPPTPDDYPPGPAWLYVLDDGIPSEGIKVMVGNPDSNGQSSHR